MALTRRQFIEAGAATTGLAVMASPLLAQIAPSSSPAPAPRAPFPPIPAQPRVMIDPVVNPQMVMRARAAFDRHRSQIFYTDVVGIADFSVASSQPRFFLVDTNSGRVSRWLVSHGRGSDPAHTGYLHRFSNQPGSEASSQGGYLTTAYYHGKYGRSMRVRGLDFTNSNAEARAIVVHTAWYAEPNVVSQQGRLGRSEGCFALPSNGLQEVMARLSPGHFIYADRLA